MKAKLGALSSARKAQLIRQADRMATEFEAQRELDSVCLVVDMDMFYAAVEIRSVSQSTSHPPFCLCTQGRGNGQRTSSVCVLVSQKQSVVVGIEFEGSVFYSLSRAAA